MKHSIWSHLQWPQKSQIHLNPPSLTAQKRHYSAVQIKWDSNIFADILGSEHSTHSKFSVNFTKRKGNYWNENQLYRALILESMQYFQIFAHAN